MPQPSFFCQSALQAIVKRKLVKHRPISNLQFTRFFEIIELHQNLVGKIKKTKRSRKRWLKRS